MADKHVDLSQAPAAIQDAVAKLKELRDEYDEGKLEAFNGVSFLEVKNQVLLDYISNLILLLNLKLRGRSIVGHAVVERLVLLRVAMDKMRPLDKKLKYQIDKIVKLSNNKQQGEGDTDDLQFKPSLANLRPKVGAADTGAAAGASDAGAEDKTEPSASSEVYKPPKIAAMPYTDDDPAAVRAEKRREKERQRVLQSTMIQDLRNQVSDRPEHIAEFEASQVAHLKGGRQSKKEREIERYEEDNFVRLPVTKKQRQKSNPRSALHDLSDFRGFKGFNDSVKGLVTDVKRKSVGQKMAEAQAQTKRAKRRGK